MGRLTEYFAYINRDPAYLSGYRNAHLTMGKERVNFNEIVTKKREVMSEEMKLVKSGDRSVAVLEGVYESIERAMEVCKFLLDSKLCPAHYYAKGPDGKTDYAKGNPSALAIVAWHGKKIGLDVMASMQQIVPVNNMISVKGDGAKSLIFTSGKLKAGTWVEEEAGSIENENYKVSISATRSDNGQTITRSFSVEMAKRAGLWVTSAQASGSDGWRYRNSAWYKYPARMVYYRALGFLARDLFPDVLQGIYTTEEANDLPPEEAIVIPQESGAKIVIPSSQFAKERSKSITGHVVSKISTSAEKLASAVEAVEYPAVPRDEVLNVFEKPLTPEEAAKDHPSNIAIDEPELLSESEEKLEEGAPEQDDRSTTMEDRSTTIEEMSKMNTEDLLAIVNGNSEMAEALMVIPGKNTNKKLRELIYAYNNGTLDEHLAPFEAAEPSGDDDLPWEKPAEEVKEERNDSIATNKYNLSIPPFDKGNERDFGAKRELYQGLFRVNPPIDNERYLELARGVEEWSAYHNKESFCQYATIKQVCDLLNKN